MRDGLAWVSGSVWLLYTTTASFPPWQHVYLLLLPSTSFSMLPFELILREDPNRNCYASQSQGLRLTPGTSFVPSFCSLIWSDPDISLLCSWSILGSSNKWNKDDKFASFKEQPLLTALECALQRGLQSTQGGDKLQNTKKSAANRTKCKQKRVAFAVGRMDAKNGKRGFRTVGARNLLRDVDSKRHGLVRESTYIKWRYSR